MSRPFLMSHEGGASFLLFVLGDDALLGAQRNDDGKIVYVFRDDARQAKSLANQFFAPESTAVGNARELLECYRSIKGARKNLILEEKRRGEI